MLSPRNRKVFSIRISFVFLDEKMSHMMKLNKDDEHKFLWQIPTLTLIYFFDVNENWATSFQLASSVLRSRSLSAKTIRLKISVLIVCPFERLREFHETLPKTNKNKLRFSRSFAYILIFLQDFQLPTKSWLFGWISIVLRNLTSLITIRSKLNTWKSSSKVVISPIF